MRHFIFYKGLTLIAILAFLFSACHESIENKAKRLAAEYTRKYCPTAPYNQTITDSVVFDTDTRTYKTYITFTGTLDDTANIKQIKPELYEIMRKSIRDDISFKAFRAAKFNFNYTCRSQKHKGQVLLKLDFLPKDYQ